MTNSCVEKNDSMNFVELKALKISDFLQRFLAVFKPVRKNDSNCEQMATGKTVVHGFLCVGTHQCQSIYTRIDFRGAGQFLIRNIPSEIYLFAVESEGHLMLFSQQAFR